MADDITAGMDGRMAVAFLTSLVRTSEPVTDSDLDAVSGVAFEEFADLRTKQAALREALRWIATDDPPFGPHAMDIAVDALAAVPEKETP